MSLTYHQQQEVERIIDRKFSSNNIFDTVKDLLNQAYFTRKVDEETNKAAGIICQRWVDGNLPRFTETTAEKYMRNNLSHIFHREIANNHEITGFISTHLNSVKDTIQKTTDAKIHDIVNANPSLNPVIQHHLATLASKNEKQLNNLSEDIKRSAQHLTRAIETNEILKRDTISLIKDVESLKQTTNALVGVSVISLAGIFSMGIHMYSKM